MENKSEEKGITRRGLFQWTLIGFGLVVSAGAIGAIANQVLKAMDPSGWFKDLYVYRKVYAAPITEINQVGASILFEDKANHRKAILVNNSGNIQAFSLVCTHLGCQVIWAKEQSKFLCPCHTAVFAADGSVESGPPERPLEQYPVEIKDGLVYISFKEPSWQPEQYFEKKEGL